MGCSEPSHVHSAACGIGPSTIGRRSLLTFGAAMAATAVAPKLSAHAAPKAAPAPKRFRIDIHHHPYFPDYMAAFGPGRFWLPLMKNWSPQASLDQMDQAGVETSILSIALPGVQFGTPEQTARIARLCNDEMTKLSHDTPHRFGVFAALPLPDMDLALKEVAYALDTLHVDGIGLYTSYNGKYLGDPSFVPLFDELNRRKAVVYTHPVTAPCCGNLVPGITDGVIEYGVDTGRTIASLVFNGAATRWPDIKFIFSHAGGVMPFLIERFDFQMTDPAVAKRVPGGLHPALRSFYYDTAQSSNPVAMGALRQVVDTSHILFGTDYPYRTVVEHVKNLAGCGFSNVQLRNIERGNATKLIPRLATA